MVRYFLVFALLLGTSNAMAQTAVKSALETTPTVIEQQTNNNDWLQYKNPYAGEQNNLANPNRTADEIIALAQKAAADALTLTPENIKMKIIDIKKGFSVTGWEQYSAYITGSQLVGMVQQKNLSTSAIFKQDAAVINTGTLSGSYKWLIRAPLMISFYKRLESGEQQAAGSGNFSLTLQIGRVDANAGFDGFVIESWKVEAVN